MQSTSEQKCVKLWAGRKDGVVRKTVKNDIAQFKFGSKKLEFPCTFYFLYKISVSSNYMCKGVKFTSDQLVLEGNAKYLERTQCLLMGMHKVAQQYFHWPKTEKPWINIFSAEKSIDKYTMVFSTSKNPEGNHSHTM